MSIIITFGTGGGARPTVEVSPLSELLATLLHKNRLIIPVVRPEVG